jgi:hypothetical protein
MGTSKFLLYLASHPERVVCPETIVGGLEDAVDSTTDVPYPSPHLDMADPAANVAVGAGAVVDGVDAVLMLSRSNTRSQYTPAKNSNAAKKQHQPLEKANPKVTTTIITASSFISSNGLLGSISSK